jgi:hypothetical protein
MPKNRLAVLPDMTHYEAFASARVAETVLPFLNGPLGGGGKNPAQPPKSPAAKK